ncbi:uncharacterized protein LOC123320074 [Coccinella septempunctata]|uniref:uncharacterized protein LOC123320074 n=1 Tax=Coccinella septempunctata TaxID=41139 RepID=UPI001D07D375|nr:uncharacterized protein LOC123320074 [Coccinella septempunctata]
MRPQIRSLQLGQVECPQFSWAVRNNSHNVCEALQPDLHQNLQKNEENEDFFFRNTEKPCCCIEQGLKPTLFPHPVSCVCSNLPCPPRNEKYRYCRLKMDQAIGDVMEEKIMDLIPPCSPFPSPRQERIMKKIIRSAYIPEEVDLTEENACVECLARDPILLKEIIDTLRNKKREEERKNANESCMEACDYCFKECEDDKSDCKRCKWRSDAICTCKETRQLDDRGDCDKSKCKCMKGCSKCTCAKPQASNTEFRPTQEGKIAQLDDRAEKKDSLKKVPKEIPEIDQKPLLPHPKEKKLKRKLKKRSKSPIKKQTWKRPESIICERFELVETNPFNHAEEPEKSQLKDPTPVQIYEHFRAVDPGSSKSNSETPERSFSRTNSTTTRQNSTTSSPSGLKNPKKVKTKPKKPSKLPWNWNNQPKAEDPLKRWSGSKYSWSRRMNYAKLSKRLEDETRSKDADEPKYFEYEPNLRTRRLHQVVKPENEEEIKEKEQRRYRQGYGRMRVKSWHQALQENAVNAMQKEVSAFSEDEMEQNADNSGNQGGQNFPNHARDVQRSYNKLFPPETQDYEENPAFKTFQRNFNDPTNTIDEQTHLEDYDNFESLSDRRLSTIIEENPGKNSSISDGSAEMGRTYRVMKPQDTKPKTTEAETFLRESMEKPFFNVIKQRIHSRNKTLENLDQFRQDLFPKKLDREHTCVHRFTIDERLFPKPLHSDRFGTSCCIHCDKPMKTTEKSVYHDRREGCVQKQVSKFSLKPKQVHMGAKNSVMEIRLRPEHDDLLKGYTGGARGMREFYPDSLALRHQRR